MNDCASAGENQIRGCSLSRAIGAITPQHSQHLIIFVKKSVAIPESYLLKIGERKGTQTTFLANIQKFVSHLLEVVPGQIQSTDFGSTLQEVKAASEKQEAARHLGICPKCQEQEVLLYQKVAACTSEACDFKRSEGFI